MKLLPLAISALFGTIGFAAAAEADSSPGEAAQLLIPQDEATSEFEYDADRLAEIETQLNQRTVAPNQTRTNTIRLPNELGLPENMLLIETNGNFAVGTELD
ncbi:hypothetical protein IQ268_10775 [Oculatella sp. LEGE 06141]|uniref:hypothetical protein n=1 Tax=Oculatella sp. LEGE 06141 TaxID=1828648 RepID=UPI0018829645|nr:hypothetical protein [Oculatella sp. LEGE 06141]MBE9179044.1 hypothetical protein [Oculatella sp. LEGE 06141]